MDRLRYQFSVVRLFVSRLLALITHNIYIYNMFIANLQNPRSGRPVPNQYCVITDDGKRYFQSYSSFIAMIDCDGEMYLHENAYLSRTTKRYLKEFLGCHDMSAQEFNKFIKNLKTY